MATVKIIEQPVKVLRFRYEREGRAGGLIVGASSSPDNKTYPKIQIEGYQGRALVIVSCVTKDEPYRPHPNKLVGRDGCRKGVCSVEVSPETMSVEFTGLGIHCMRRKDVEDSLKLRKDIRVDPFRTGFARYKHSISFDLTAVRLCFQVLLQDEHGDFTIPLSPVVSEPIYDKRVVSDLMIIKVSKCCSPVNGGKEEIIVVCDKVVKNDIQIRFYEERDGQLVWEGFGIFQPSDVYKKVVIWFKPPSYKSLSITQPVKVFMQLQRPSDGETSESLPFEYLPIDSENGMLNRIRYKSRNLLRNFSEPPLSRLEQNSTTSFPESVNIYNNLDSANPPNQQLSPLQQYNLPIAMNPMPLMSNLQHSNFQFPDLQLDKLSTSGTMQLRRDERVCDLNLIHTANLPLSSQQEYSPSVDFFNSMSHSTNVEDSLPFPVIEHERSAQNDAQTGIITETQNNPSEMDIQTVYDLSRLLIDGNNQQSELQQLNLDSGELDTMNISN